MRRNWKHLACGQKVPQRCRSKRNDLKDDPQLVREMILKLRRSGEIEADDLRYLERIADRWLEITEKNLQKARR
jgi:hypothetical protein